MNDKFKKLAEPFPEETVYWRVGATDDKNNPTRGCALAYIDARHVMNRLDEVVGPTNWQDAYVETSSGRVICQIEIFVEGVGWVAKSDGAGATDFEGAKGAISDAFKRAAVKWGIGRYLYALDAPWVPVEKRGRTVRIKKGYEPQLPDWAKPDTKSEPSTDEGDIVRPTGKAQEAGGGLDCDDILAIPKEWPTHVYNKVSGLAQELIGCVGIEQASTRVGRLIGYGYGVERLSELSKPDAKKFISDLTNMVQEIATEEKEHGS